MRSFISAGRRINSFFLRISTSHGGGKMNHFQLGEEELFCGDDEFDDEYTDEEESEEDNEEGEDDDKED